MSSPYPLIFLHFFNYCFFKPASRLFTYLSLFFWLCTYLSALSSLSCRPFHLLKILSSYTPIMGNTNDNNGKETKGKEERWEQGKKEANDGKIVVANKRCSSKKKKDNNSKRTGFWIRILGINAIMLGYFRNCKLKEWGIKQ